MCLKLAVLSLLLIVSTGICADFMNSNYTEQNLVINMMNDRLNALESSEENMISKTSELYSIMPRLEEDYTGIRSDNEAIRSYLEANKFDLYIVLAASCVTLIIGIILSYILVIREVKQFFSMMKMNNPVAVIEKKDITSYKKIGMIKSAVLGGKNGRA